MSLPDKHGTEVYVHISASVFRGELIRTRYCNPISTRTSPRKRSASQFNIAQASSPPKRRTTRQRVCPHTMSMLRSPDCWPKTNARYAARTFFIHLLDMNRSFPSRWAADTSFAVLASRHTDHPRSSAPCRGARKTSACSRTGVSCAPIGSDSVRTLSS
jgi:hypothetical protein